MRPAPSPLRVLHQSQAANATAMAAPSTITTPRAPASCASTHTNQTAAAYIGKARNCLKVSIQGPGLGMKDSALGQMPSRMKGRAKPAPSATKIANADTALCVNAKPSAPAMKGAVQGAATATA